MRKLQGAFKDHICEMNSLGSPPAPPYSSICVTWLGSCLGPRLSVREQTKTTSLVFPDQPEDTMFWGWACNEFEGILSVPLLLSLSLFLCSCFLFFRSGNSQADVSLRSCCQLHSTGSCYSSLRRAAWPRAPTHEHGTSVERPLPLAAGLQAQLLVVQAIPSWHRLTWPLSLH